MVIILFEPGFRVLNNKKIHRNTGEKFVSLFTGELENLAREELVCFFIVGPERRWFQVRGRREQVGGTDSRRNGVEQAGRGLGLFVSQVGWRCSHWTQVRCLNRGTSARSAQGQLNVNIHLMRQALLFEMYSGLISFLTLHTLFWERPFASKVFTTCRLCNSSHDSSVWGCAQLSDDLLNKTLYKKLSVVRYI